MVAADSDGEGLRHPTRPVPARAPGLAATSVRGGTAVSDGGADGSADGVLDVLCATFAAETLNRVITLSQELLKLHRFYLCQ